MLAGEAVEFAFNAASEKACREDAHSRDLRNISDMYTETWRVKTTINGQKNSPIKIPTKFPGQVSKDRLPFFPSLLYWEIKSSPITALNMFITVRFGVSPARRDKYRTCSNRNIFGINDKINRRRNEEMDR